MVHRQFPHNVDKREYFFVGSSIRGGYEVCGSGRSQRGGARVITCAWAAVENQEREWAVDGDTAVAEDLSAQALSCLSLFSDVKAESIRLSGAGDQISPMVHASAGP